MTKKPISAEAASHEAVPSVTRAYRRDRRGQDLFRQRVLDVTRSMFETEGAEALSMRRIAAAVDAAPMTLYRYFPSKAHLLRDIWEGLLEQSFVAGRADAAAQPDPRRRPGAFVDGFIGYWLERPANYRLVFTAGQGQAVSGTPVAATMQREAVQRHADEVLRVLDDCLPDRPWPPEAREREGDWIFCQCLGYLHAMLYFADHRWQDPAWLRQVIVEGVHRRVGEAIAAQGTPGPAADAAPAAPS